MSKMREMEERKDGGKNRERDGKIEKRIYEVK